ncbi:MAG: hypothetical protein RI885_1490 [Actinomycetota bacterium]|jgi:uncharacterized protein (TIGR03086 family)
MRIQELFIHSNVALAAVVEQIDEDRWKLELPASSPTTPQDLRVTIGYHAYDDAWVPDVLAGRSAQEVGDRFDHLLDPSEAGREYREQNARAIRAVREFDDLGRIVHLSYGDFPAEEYLQHITSFRFVRAWDIARLLGTRPDFPEEFLLAVEQEFAPHMVQYRAMGVFPDPIEVAADADTLTRVVGGFGRA